MSILAAPHPRVLVAEHDGALRDLLVALLHLERYTPDAAASLEEAYDKVDYDLYDLVLTDLFSPSPPRLEAIKRLPPRCYPTPVGILSGWRVGQEEAQRAGFAFALEKPLDLEILLKHIVDHLHPALSPLQQEQANSVTSCLAALNARHWGALRALLRPEVAYLPLRRSSFTAARAIFGQEAVLAHVQGALRSLPEFRIDHRGMVPHHQHLVTRFRSSWKGSNGQRQQIAGSAFFHFRGEWISQIGVTLNIQHLQLLLEPTP